MDVLIILVVATKQQVIVMHVLVHVLVVMVVIISDVKLVEHAMGVSTAMQNAISGMD